MWCVASRCDMIQSQGYSMLSEKNTSGGKEEEKDAAYNPKSKANDSLCLYSISQWSQRISVILLICQINTVLTKTMWHFIP